LDSKAIKEKFGADYFVDELTFKMGIDQRFTTHFAERFRNKKGLEICTGAGFTTISLARTASHVYTVEIDKHNQEQAIKNVEKAGLSEKVTFIEGDILDEDLLKSLPTVDAIFIDPDWADTRSDHIYSFINSTTQPPADVVLEKAEKISKNVAIVLPPFIDVNEFASLPDHEREELYFGKSHELFCLYFGRLKKSVGATKFRVDN